MSVEKVKEFLLALKEKGADEAWTAKAAEAKSGEERYALMADMAKDMGYDLTADDERLSKIAADCGAYSIDNRHAQIEQFMRRNCGLYFKTVEELKQFLFG